MDGDGLPGHWFSQTNPDLTLAFAFPLVILTGTVSTLVSTDPVEKRSVRSTFSALAIAAVSLY